MAITPIRLWIGKTLRVLVDLKRRLLNLRALRALPSDIMGAMCLVRGNDSLAEIHFRRSLECRMAVLPELHPHIAGSLRVLGMLYVRLGRFTNALPLFERALSILLATGNSHRQEIAEISQMLAATLVATGAPLKALPHQKRATDIAQLKSSPAADPDLLTSIGATSLELGQWNTARHFLTTALELRGAAHGRPSAGLAINLHYLGLLHFHMGNSRAAGPLLNEAMTVGRSFLAREPAAFARILLAVGMHARATDNYQQSRKYFFEALELQRSTLGNDHVDVAESLRCIGELYRSQCDFEEARQFLSSALEEQHRLRGYGHPTIGVTAAALGDLYLESGNYELAEQFYRQAMDIARNVFGTDHIAYAAPLHNLGVLCSRTGRYHKALQHFAQAATIIENALGVDTEAYADCIGNLGDIHRTLGLYDVAEAHLNRALRIHEALLNEDNLSAHEALHSLAQLYEATGRQHQAESILERVLNARRSCLGDEHPKVAVAFCSIARLCADAGSLDRARQLYRQAESIQRRLLGDHHVSLAHSLNGCGEVCQAVGDYSTAEDLITEALEVRRHALCETHPDVAESLTSLAQLKQALGDYQPAMTLAQQALGLRLQAFGDRHPLIGESMHNIGFISEKLGHYREADALYRAALDIVRTSHSSENHRTALILTSLAGLYRAIGRGAKAAELLKEALNIRRRVFGDGHYQVARSMANLATHLDHRTRFQEADSLFEGALNVFRVAAPDSADVAQCLANRAGNFFLNGKYKQGADSIAEAIDRQVVTLGKGHPDTLRYMAILASGLVYAGKATDAVPLFQQIVAAQRGILGEHHPQLIYTKMLLALAMVETGLPDAVFELLSEAFLPTGYVLETLLLLSPARERIGYLSRFDLVVELTLSILFEHYLHDSMKVRQALDAVIHRKAIGLRLGKAEHLARLGEQYPKQVELLRQFSSAVLQRTRKRVNGTRREGTDQHPQSSEEWSTMRTTLEENLEASISETGVAAKLHALDSRTLSHQLPSRSALLTIVRFRPYSFAEHRSYPGRYVGLVLNAECDADVRAVDLGDTDSMDQLVAGFREAITALGSGRSAMQTISAQLCDRLIEPLTANLASECNRLILCLEGSLTMLPFEVLARNNGRLLSDDFPISYVTDPRDAALINEKPSLKSSPPLILANPAFTLSSEHRPLAVTSALRELAMEIKHPLLPLAGSEIEATHVASKLSAEVWQGRHATGTILKTARSPSVLHISTHGLFLEDTACGQPDYSHAGLFPPALDDDDQAPHQADSMLRSGLLFAGAEDWRCGAELSGEFADAVMLAADIARIDLRGTELVVLSACETGLGNSIVGDGVYGLQRAFSIAGARSMVMSLWKVDDLATAILMDNFYEFLLAGLNKDDALRRAQAVLRQATVQDLRAQWLNEQVIDRLGEDNLEYQHRLYQLMEGPDLHRPFEAPFYWGAFICQGNITPLSGRER